MNQKKAERAVKVFNDARAQASRDYIGAVPEATVSLDFARAFAPIVQYTPFMNEFLNYVVNKLVFQTVESKMYENKFSMLRREGFPLGTDYENNYINPALPRAYGIELGDTLLNRKKPDVKTQYFRRNREDQFWITIPEPLLRGAYTQWEQLDDFITGAIRSLYSGNAIKEQHLVKTLFVDGVTQNIIRTQTITGYDETGDAANSANLLIKAVRGLTYNFTFPSADFNNWLVYAQAQGIQDDRPAITWVENNDILAFIRTSALVNAQVDSLAAAFNLNEGDFRSRVIPVDSFSYQNNEGETVSNDKLIAIVCDRKAFEYRDNFTQASDFFNAAGLYRNHYLTVFQTYGINVCANAIALLAP